MSDERWSKENELLSGDPEALVKIITQQAQEIERLERDNKILTAKTNNSLANNLCPDCRDKQLGKPCLACTIQTLDRKLAAMTRERDELNVAVTSGIRHRQEYVERIDALVVELATAQARCREMESELVKWQQPFDADMLKEVEQQASHGDSLAAQRVYITALEHGLKQLQATLTAREARLTALESAMLDAFPMLNNTSDEDTEIKERLRLLLNLHEE